MTRHNKVIVSIADSDRAMKKDLEIGFSKCNWSEEYIERAVRTVGRSLKTQLSYTVEERISDSDETVYIVSHRPDLDRNPDSNWDMPDELFNSDTDLHGYEEVFFNGAPEYVYVEMLIGLLDYVQLVTFIGDNGGVSLRPGADRELIKQTLEVVRNVNRTDDGTEILDRAWAGGRPPLGCEVENGQLIKGDDFRDVSRALLQVRRGELSKRKASKRLGCARKTISTAIENRSEFYDIV